MIKLTELLDESDASDQAQKLGLDFMSFGRYGKDGKVTHISKDGKLVPVQGKKSKVVEPFDAQFGNIDEPPKRNAAHIVPRTPSLKKRVKSRISPERFIRHNMGLKAPKGLGYLTNPQKAVRNVIYNFLHNKII
jgi:hypothetical protein